MKSMSFLLILAFTITLGHAAESPRRVQPPVWTQDVLDAFFEDAREQLVGTRPQRDARKVVGTLVAKMTSSEEQPSDAAQKWSALIDADTLTAEIKRVHNQLATALKKSAGFLGGGNLICQRDFGLLAVLFGVIDRFDEEVRWQRSAKLMQQRCFQASKNCQAASAQSFSAAKEMHAVLGQLLRGQVLRGQAPAGETVSPGTNGPKLTDRTLLMQSMELAIQQRLKPALANAREFRKRSQLAFEQAQLLAVLAEVIQQAGYEYADDDTYLDEARLLRQTAQELVQAAHDKNYEAARAAAGQVGQSCSRCHENYR